MMQYSYLVQKGLENLNKDLEEIILFKNNRLVA